VSKRWQLRILQGVHTGATHELATGSYDIGSDFAGDIALLDANVAPRHLRLSIEAAGAYVEAYDGAPLSINGTPPTVNGRVLLGATDLVECGGTAFRVEALPESMPAAQPPEEDQPSDARSPGAAQRMSRWRWSVIVPVLAMVLAPGVALWQLLHAPEARAPLSPAQHPAPVPPRDDIVSRVREFVGDEHLVIQRGSKAEVIISGVTHAKGAREQVQRIRAEYAGAVEIKDEVSYVEDEAPRQVELPQRITDVRAGPVRWFRTADGDRYFEGSQLQDGAEVVRIGLDAIVFRRAGRLTEYRPAELGWEGVQR
jgi:hypothetical protein